MARTRTVTKPFEPRTVKISGSTYDIASLNRFRLRPDRMRKVGAFGGVMYTYTVTDRQTLNDLLDRIAIAAADYADKHGAENPTYLQITKDAGRLM